jgi:superfamily II DNA/RNA helicase
VLAPTRELADQIRAELSPLAKVAFRYVTAIYGGVGYGGQRAALRKGVDVLVATPGRLEDLIEQRSVDLGDVDIVVVDEADRMADMGFLPAVRRILDGTSRNRQTLLFSATLDGDIAVLSRDYQNDPVRHDAGTVEPRTVDARHHFWLVDHHERVRHTADVIDTTGRAIVFARTRRGVDRLTRQLSKLGVGAIAIHGGRSQSQRNRALREFTSHRVQALVATDVAARGLHIDAVESVIHFDPPADAKDYLHRSGRTARAGASGIVVSLVTGHTQRDVQRMQRHLDLDAPIGRPRIDALGNGGHRLAEPGHRPGEPDEQRSTRPQPGRADRKPRASRSRAPRRAEEGAVGGKAASIYVANLPWRASAAELTTLFGRYGDVHDSTIITDRQSGRSRGFGFVSMPSPAATAAVAALDGATFGGRDLTVRLARPRRPRR